MGAAFITFNLFPGKGFEPVALGVARKAAESELSDDDQTIIEKTIHQLIANFQPESAEQFHTALHFGKSELPEQYHFFSITLSEDQKYALCSRMTYPRPTAA